jgi:hypothetical protein
MINFMVELRNRSTLTLMWLIGGGLQLSIGGTIKPQPNRRFFS